MGQMVKQYFSDFIRLMMVVTLAVLGSAASLAQTLPPDESESGPVRLELEIEPGEIYPGEVISAVLTVKWQDGVEILPSAIPPKVEGLELLEWEESPEQEAHTASWKQKQIFMSLSAYETGEITLEPMVIRYIDSEGKDATTQSSPQSIRVKSYLENVRLDKGEEAVTLQKLRPPLEIPASRLWLWLLLFIFLLLIALALVLYFILPRMRGTIAPRVLEKPPLAPDEEALHALAELETDEAWRKAPVKEYYSNLSDILRRYLGRSYAFDALEMTSYELLDHIRGYAWPGDLYELLRLDLRESDSVKFAQYAPAHDRRQAALERVRSIVMATRPERETAHTQQEATA
ncbi:MAG: hypothetical protein ACLFQ6_00125 [Candidatus Sumerlaeia bacterium]